MIVSSGHGVHFYWRLIEPITELKTWTVLQKRLIKALNSDPGVHDPARLMRLPGFLNHNGDEPVECSVLSVGPERQYLLQQFDEVLPSLKDSTKNEYTTQIATRASANRDHILDRALKYQERVPAAERGERNSRAFQLAAAVVEKFNLSADEAQTVASTYNARSPEPLDEAEVEEVTGKAVRHVQQKAGPRGTALDVPVEQIVEQPGPTVSLADWRKQMADARLDSLTDPGVVFVDRSTTGAGKSTADLQAMRAAGRSITFLPTHDACEELAEKLREQGLKAAAFPAIDETTCQMYRDGRRPGEAQLVQSAGLDVGSTLCSDCPLFRGCEYQRRREAARTADHVVATHARAAHSHFAVVADRPLVFVHEDCRDLLRPMLRIAAKPTKGTPHLRHLRDVYEVAREALAVAERMADSEKETFAVALAKSTRELIDRLGDEELLTKVERAAAENRLNEISRVQPLPLKERTFPPERFDRLLFRAMRSSGVDLDGTALRLCLAYTCGDLVSLCLVADDVFEQGAKDKRNFSQSLVSVRQIHLPDDRIVWIEDATGEPDILSQLVGRPIQDRTPAGQLAFTIPPLQYARTDVTQHSSGNVVRGIVRGLLARYAQSRRVGLITHQVHLPELRKLEPFWLARLAKLDHYRSGNDRASNRWLDCDLLIILGTPRVPPPAYRQALIQLGQLDAAGADGQWRPYVWRGEDVNGQTTDLECSGYSHPEWRKVHQLLVRSLLLQAVGRGRGVTAQGIPVILVSNEPLGLPFASEPLHELKDSVAETFDILRKLTAENPNRYILGDSAVTTPLTASASGRSERQTREHLTLLSSFGLLTRQGARGGWTIAPELSV